MANQNAVIEPRSHAKGMIGESKTVAGETVSIKADPTTGGINFSEVGQAVGQARSTETTATNDNYATILTLTAAANHLRVSLQGSNDAILSLDGGTTEHMVIVAGAIEVLPVYLANGTVIKAKNKTAGSNFSKLNINVW